MSQRGAKRARAAAGIGPDGKPNAVAGLQAVVVERRYVSVLTKQDSGLYRYVSQERRLRSQRLRTRSSPVVARRCALPTGQARRLRARNPRQPTAAGSTRSTSACRRGQPVARAGAQRRADAEPVEGQLPAGRDHRDQRARAVPGQRPDHHRARQVFTRTPGSARTPPAVGAEDPDARRTSKATATSTCSSCAIRTRTRYS